MATINGLPASLSTDWVAARITALGYTPLSVTNVIGSITSLPTNNFRVLLQFQENNQAFLELKSLGTFKVKVEKIYRRRKLVLQCYKCQRFGHTLRDCTATEPTCVKCAGQHTSRICSITDQADRSCSNCKGKHPASWDRCPIYLAALQAKGLSKKSSRAKSAIQPCLNCHELPQANRGTQPKAESPVPEQTNGLKPTDQGEGKTLQLFLKESCTSRDHYWNNGQSDGLEG
ncbi:hypothetical protein ACLKA6_008128 [Drosophila palustris]